MPPPRRPQPQPQEVPTPMSPLASVLRPAAGGLLLLAALGLAGCASGASARERFETERAATLYRSPPSPGAGAPHAALILPADGLGDVVRGLVSVDDAPRRSADLALPGGISAALVGGIDRGAPRVSLSAACDGCVHVEQPVTGSVGLDLSGLESFGIGGGRIGVTGAAGADFALEAVVAEGRLALVARPVGEPTARLSLDVGGVLGALRPVLEVAGRDRLAEWARSLLPRGPVELGSVPLALPALPGISLTAARVIRLARPGPALALLVWTDAAPERPTTLDPSRVTPSAGSASLALDEAAVEAAIQRISATHPTTAAGGSLALLARSLRFEDGEAILGGRGYLLPGRGAVWHAEARVVLTLEPEAVRAHARQVRVWSDASGPRAFVPGEDEVDRFRTRISATLPRTWSLGHGTGALDLRLAGARIEAERLVLDASLAERGAPGGGP